MPGGKGKSYRGCFEAFSDDIVANLSSSFIDKRIRLLHYISKRYVEERRSVEFMRQKVRKCLLLISFLAFPITIWYFSPYLIINAAMEHIINGSFVVFCLKNNYDISVG